MHVFYFTVLFQQQFPEPHGIAVAPGVENPPKLSALLEVPTIMKDIKFNSNPSSDLLTKMIEKVFMILKACSSS